MVVGIAAAGLDEAGLDIVERGEALLQFGARLGRLARPFADLVGGGLIDHDRDDVLQRPAILAHQRGIEQRQPQQRQREGAQRRPARASPQGERDQREREARQPLEEGKRQQRREGDRPRVQCESLSRRSLAWTWSAL